MEEQDINHLESSISDYAFFIKFSDLFSCINEHE
jgi:hypothetical protein